MSHPGLSRKPSLPAAALVAATFGSALPAHARLDPATEGRHGGVCSNDCADARALRVRFFGDFMAVERAGKAVNASRVRASNTYPAAASPPDFKAVIRGEVAGGDGLAFVLHHNAEGLLAVIDGGGKSLSALGSGVRGQRLRHCDPNRNPLPGAAPVLRKATVAGVRYTVGASCKPHDCGESNLVLLRDEGRPSVLALVHQAGRETLLGAPSPAMGQELRRLWRQEWRQGR